jgi:hypothetical protein
MQRVADARVLARRVRTLDERRAQQARIAAEREETERLRRRLERMRMRRPWLAASAILLLLGLSSATLLWLRAVRANEHAKREAALAEAVNEFLTDDLLARADPLQSGRRDVPIGLGTRARTSMKRLRCCAGRWVIGTPPRARRSSCVGKRLGRCRMLDWRALGHGSAMLHGRFPG